MKHIRQKGIRSRIWRWVELYMYMYCKFSILIYFHALRIIFIVMHWFLQVSNTFSSDGLGYSYSLSKTFDKVSGWIRIWIIVIRPLLLSWFTSLVGKALKTTVSLDYNVLILTFNGLQITMKRPEGGHRVL